MEDHLDIDLLQKVYEDGAEEFQDYVKGLDIGVGVYDAQASPIVCNKAAYELLGLTHDQFMGRSAMDPYWKVIHKDGSRFETHDFPIIQVTTKYEPIVGVIMGVSRPLKNDRIWLEVNTHPVSSYDGSIKHIFCTYKDITDKIEKWD